MVWIDLLTHLPEGHRVLQDILVVKLHRIPQFRREILEAAVQAGTEEVKGIVVVPLREVCHVDLPLDAVAAEQLLHPVDQVGLVVQDVVGRVGAGVVVPSEERGLDADW